MSNQQTTTNGIDAVENRKANPVVMIDYALYERYLEKSDLSDDQKKEFLDTLWSIIVSFVDLGFGVHPLQQVDDDACGQKLDLTALLTADVVSSDTDKPKTQFEKAAECRNDNRAESADS